MGGKEQAWRRREKRRMTGSRRPSGVTLEVKFSNKAVFIR